MSRLLDDNLDDISDLIARIEKDMAGVAKEEFLQNAEKLDAATYRLAMLGEALKKLPDDLKDRNPEIPWREVRAFRNVASHDYFGINPDFVWAGVQQLEPIKEMCRAEQIRLDFERRAEERERNKDDGHDR